MFNSVPARRQNPIYRSEYTVSDVDVHPPAIAHEMVRLSDGSRGELGTPVIPCFLESHTPVLSVSEGQKKVIGQLRCR